MKTIQEILAMSPTERKTEYMAENISNVIIDGNVFTDYGTFSFIREKSYVTSPERSSGGVIDNLNAQATFTTPHLTINFSMMSIDSYRRLMSLIYSKNEFLVTCYDVVQNKQVTQKMYFATEQMPKLWTIARALNGEEWVELIGVQDYTVELIGTNADLEYADILFYDEYYNPMSGLTQRVEIGTEAVIDVKYSPSVGRFANKWRDRNNGVEYVNGSVVTVIGEIQLVPVIVPTNEYTLSFNYGKGIVPIRSANAQPVSEIPITVGNTINSAIARANISTSTGKFVFPENGTGLDPVTYSLGGEQFTVDGSLVYDFNGWYSADSVNSTRITGESVYGGNRNKTIYQVYEPIIFEFQYRTNTSDISLSPQYIAFGLPTVLPTLARSGYRFGGWYLDEAFTKSAPTTMPPKAITVYAKWEKVE